MSLASLLRGAGGRSLLQGIGGALESLLHRPGAGRVSDKEPGDTSCKRLGCMGVPLARNRGVPPKGTGREALGHLPCQKPRYRGCRNRYVVGAGCPESPARLGAATRGPPSLPVPHTHCRKSRSMSRSCRRENSRNSPAGLKTRRPPPPGEPSPTARPAGLPGAGPGRGPRLRRPSGSSAAAAMVRCPDGRAAPPRSAPGPGCGAPVPAPASGGSGCPPPPAHRCPFGPRPRPDSAGPAPAPTTEGSLPAALHQPSTFVQTPPLHRHRRQVSAIPRRDQPGMILRVQHHQWIPYPTGIPLGPSLGSLLTQTNP